MPSRSQLCFALSLLSLSIGAAFAGESSAPSTKANATPLAAQPHSAPKTGPALDPQALARAQAKLAHAVGIADRFAQSAIHDGLPERWRFEMVNSLMQIPESRFEQIQGTDNARNALQAAASLAATSRATASSSSPGDDQIQLIGDIGDDLTYIPLSSPCRIVDTRSGGGPLAANVPSTFFFDALSGQGGAYCNPFGGYVGGGRPGAAAVNITVIGSSTAVPGSYLQAYPDGGSTTTSWLNYGPGQTIANAGVLPIAIDYEFVLISNASTQAIVDVFGSFVRPAATPLECTTASNSDTVPKFSLVANVAVPACPGGYSQTGVYCNGLSAVGGGGVVGTSHGFCEFRNPSGTDFTGNAVAQCCRLPGRR